MTTATTPTPTTGIRLRRVVLMVVLSIVVYAAFALWGDVHKIGIGLGRFRWWTFGAALGLAFGNYVLRFFKWQFYLARLDVRDVGVVDSFLTFLSGFALTVSPGKVGEIFKSIVLLETHGVPIERTAPIVVADRLSDVLGIAVLIAIGSIGFRGGLVPAALGAAFVLALVVVVSSRRASRRVIAFVSSLPGPFRKIGPRLDAAYDSLALLVSPKNLVLPTLLSTAAWLLECLALAVILRGFAADVPVTLCTFFYATSTLAGAASGSPGGIGVTEAGLREQMTTMGHVDAATSTAAMMLVRFATLWFAVALGFAAIAAIKRRYPHLLKS